MRVPCLSEEGDHLLHKQAKLLPKIKCSIFMPVKIEGIFPISMQSRKFNILLSMVITALLPWLQKPGLKPSLKPGFKPKLISALV